MKPLAPFAVALLALLGSAARCEVEGSADLPSGTLDTVTVQAHGDRERLEQRVSSFVAAVATRASGEALARWQVPVCPRVFGLPQGEAQFVEQRLLRVAQEAGAVVAQAPCSGNFIVIMTGEPEKLLQELLSRYPRSFNDSRGIGGIKRFVAGGLPVRVWYNACSASPGAAHGATSAGNLGCNSGQIGSRLVFESVRAIYSVIAVVDLTRIEGLRFGQLSDYLAMTGLAQIRTEVAAGELPSILRLLVPGANVRPDALSDWDRAFLRALYATDASSTSQVPEIERTMTRNLQSD